MKDYEIRNHLDEGVVILTNRTVEEVEDYIYELKEHHGFQMEFTYKEVKRRNKEMKKEEILILIQEKIRKLEDLSDTRNGFEMACKGGVAALRELLDEILNGKEE
jgi:hypothetical protein